jgi:isopentenyl diphosphate isomerase/L-lactate dehydrogenase-like FMN-dependent dehydrogenase
VTVFPNAAPTVGNHGGRQLDYSIAALDALFEVVEGVGSNGLVLMDGGARRGRMSSRGWRWAPGPC